MQYGQRLPMVEDFYTDLGADVPVNPALMTPPTAPAPASPVGALLVFGLMMALPIGGAILGYKLLEGRMPLGGLVGALGGWFIVPKVAGPVLGPILKPFAEKALAAARAKGCTTCG